MNEGSKSRKVRKSGSQEVSKKSEVESLKPEEINNSAPDNYRNNIPHSEIKELPTANQKLQTETMEVHHHPEVEKKGIKEYILEGLMIFLAVTMGFFAETIREGISDREKGKEYIKSFVHDLRRDTVSFSRILAYDEDKRMALNNLYPCFNTIEKNRKSASCLVPILKMSFSNKVVNFTDGTMQQLKNAGGFRLLKKDDKDSIIAYDLVVKAFNDYQSTAFQESQDNLRTTYNMLGNFKADVLLFPDSVKRNVDVPLLFSDDKALLNRFFNDLAFYRRANGNQMKQVRKLKGQALRLIKYFDNKYEINNEEE
jgi:hypothetical protein